LQRIVFMALRAGGHFLHKETPIEIAKRMIRHVPQRHQRAALLKEESPASLFMVVKLPSWASATRRLYSKVLGQRISINSN
jgi:hypothetical protein